MSQMQEPSALERILDLVRDLRARCPWDAAQTPQSLRPYFVEEAAELDHAVSLGQPAAIRNELGDVMLHVAFHIVLAEEREWFDAETLTRAVEEKMWRRHPHLFGDAAGETTAAEVKDRWERHKLRERPGGSVLESLPPTLPALVLAYRLQEKAAGVGFDWPDARGPLEKVREETEEIVEEMDAGGGRPALEREVGDLLFAAVNLARKLDVDPRAALEGANRRFVDRFQGVEHLAAERGVDLGTVGIDVLDALWEEVKQTRRRADGKTG